MKIRKQNHWGWYTEPKLITWKNNLKKPWFIKFSFTEKSSGKTLPVQLKCGINYEHSVKSRTLAGKAHLLITNENLQNDWHPRLDIYPEFEETGLPYEIWQNKTVISAISEVFANKKLAKDSKKDYRLAIDYLDEALTALDLQNTRLKDLKKSTVLVAMDAYKQLRNASDKQYNKNLGYLKSLISTAAEYAEMEYSPAARIKEIPVCESNGFKIPTDEEQAIIKEHMQQYHPNFYRLMMVIYHTGIRIKESLALRISDIDFKHKRFVIIPDEQRNNSKTKKIRMVTINNHLWKHISEMQLQDYPAESYIFGSPGTAGRGWTGVSGKDGYYLPNPTRIKRDTATKFWHRVVKIGLGIDCDLYALKHKGAQDKIRAGMSMDAIQELFGHTDRRMTKKYLHSNVFASEILEKSPDF